MNKALLARGLSILAASVPLAAVTRQVQAQNAGSANVERFERQLEQIQRDQRLHINPDVPADQRALLDYGGYLSLNFLAIDDPQQSTHILRQYDLVGYARLNIDNVHEFFLRARTGYRDFNSGDSFDGDGDETTWPTIEQAYYRFSLAKYLNAYQGKDITNDVTVQLGRQFVFWANGLVLAQTLDGGMLDVTYGNLQLQLLAGRTAHDVVDFDPSRPGFEDRTDRGFFGALAAAQLGKHKPFAYALVQRDYNEDVTGTAGAKFEYNSYYLGTGVNGSIGDRLVYGVEGVFEGGRGRSTNVSLSDPSAPFAQEKDDISAAALDVRLDYLLADPHRSRASFEAILASGDSDRERTNATIGGNLPGTEDHAFNAFGLLNTGLAFSPPVSNLISLRAGYSTFPFSTGTFRRMQVGGDLLFFAKMEEDGGVDESTYDKRVLGLEPDLYMNWQVTSDVTFALRYGVFFPGPAIIEDGNPRHFFFAGLTFAF